MLPLLSIGVPRLSDVLGGGSARRPQGQVPSVVHRRGGSRVGSSDRRGRLIGQTLGAARARKAADLKRARSTDSMNNREQITRLEIATIQPHCARPAAWQGAGSVHCLVRCECHAADHRHRRSCRDRVRAVLRLGGGGTGRRQFHRRDFHGAARWRKVPPSACRRWCRRAANSAPSAHCWSSAS